MGLYLKFGIYLSTKPSYCRHKTDKHGLCCIITQSDTYCHMVNLSFCYILWELYVYMPTWESDNYSHTERRL